MGRGCWALGRREECSRQGNGEWVARRREPPSKAPKPLRFSTERWESRSLRFTVKITQKLRYCLTNYYSVSAFSFFFFLRQSLGPSAAQAGVQWCDLSSLHPPSPGFKQLSCLILLNSWNYRWVSPRTCLIFVFLVETGFHLVDQEGLDLLTS